MKKLTLFILALFLLPSILAIDISVNKTSSNEVIILGLNNPATFNLQIKNLGSADSFMFYTFFGIDSAPRGTVDFSSGETKSIDFVITPRDDLKQTGYQTFDYFIRGLDKTEVKKQLTVEIINLEDAFEIGSEEVTTNSDRLKIYIHNKEKFKFENINARFSSEFFDFEKQFTLEPNQRKDFEVAIDKESYKKLLAGYYTLNAEITVENLDAQVEGKIKFDEKDELNSNFVESGILISSQILENSNNGNVIKDSVLIANKSLFLTPFTSFNIDPDYSQRNGLTKTYTWTTKLSPGETQKVIMTTNWFFPIIFIGLILAIVFLIRKYNRTYLDVRKETSLVRTKGGEFAIKVSIYLHAKEYLERVNVIDRLPVFAKIYDKFSSEVPAIVDEKRRKIEWTFQKLEEGEVRVFSYIIYSKMGVLGKFALPRTRVLFERAGELKETNSNLAFFAREQHK